MKFDFIDIIKPEPLQATDGIGSRMLDEATYPSDFKNGVGKVMHKKLMKRKSAGKVTRK